MGGAPPFAHVPQKGEPAECAREKVIARRRTQEENISRAEGGGGCVTDGDSMRLALLDRDRPSRDGGLDAAFHINQVFSPPPKTEPKLRRRRPLIAPRPLSPTLAAMSLRTSENSVTAANARTGLDTANVAAAINAGAPNAYASPAVHVPTAGQRAVVSAQQGAQSAATTQPGALSGFGAARPKTLGRGEKDPVWLRVAYIVGSVILPPLVVFLKTGDACETVINIAWFILGWLPAVVHSLIVVSGDTRCTCMTDCALDVTPGSRLASLSNNNNVNPPVTTARPTVVTTTKDSLVYDGPATGGTSRTVSPAEPRAISA